MPDKPFRSANYLPILLIPMIKATAHSFSMTCLLSIAVGLQMQDMWFKIRREKAFRDP
jgi:hypothetical protein